MIQKVVCLQFLSFFSFRKFQRTHHIVVCKSIQYEHVDIR